MFKRIVAAQADGSESVTAAANLVADRNPSATVEPFHIASARHGHVLDELLTHVIEANADLLVLGAHRHVIAGRAAMLAPASVLMIPEGTRLALSHLVVPIDFSSSSEQALRSAVALAGPAGKITAIAVECDDEPWLEWPGDHGRMQQKLIDFVKQHAPGATVDCITEPLSHSGFALPHDGLSPARRIEGADVAATLLAAIQRIGASLIVMGTRGRTRSASILLGSVTEQVMQASHIPVLALKTAQHPLNLAEAILSRLTSRSETLPAS